MGSTVAAAVGVEDRLGRSVEDTLVAELGTSDVLIATPPGDGLDTNPRHSTKGLKDEHWVGVTGLEPVTSRV